MKKIFILILFIIIGHFVSFAQQGSIKGRVFNQQTNEAIPFANVLIEGTQIGSTTDFDGNFIITGVSPGFYRLRVSSLGFDEYFTEEIQVINGKSVNLDVPLSEAAFTVEEVEVTAKRFVKKEESPVSLRSIGISEIENNPGANRDISKVIQSFPGVASTPVNRNDVIVRGGGPNESKFFLDGVEIPNINHFATQGSSGGSNGILNADLLREVEFYSGAFPSNRGNATSGVFNFKQIDGNKDKAALRGSIGASETSFTVDGPIGEKTSYVFSVRRSYLQFLFKALGLPFLPTFNDMQFKVKTRINDKNEISLIGLGAYDINNLDLDIENPDENQRYILGFLPESKQWNYTLGSVYKHYGKNGYQTVVLSQSYLNNGYFKYLDNDKSSENNLILDYKSVERETKFRYENNLSLASYKFNFGVGSEYAEYFNETYQKRFNPQIGDLLSLSYNSDLSFYKYNFFGQISKNYLNNRLGLSLGVRADGNTYSSKMNNPLKRLSPRVSLSYSITEALSFNANTGIYYQLPPYTALGYRNNSNILVNKENNIDYFSATHHIAGFEFLPKMNLKVTLEGFYKLYDNYLFSVSDSIPLANRPPNFGTFGDEELTSEAQGRAYGIEFLVQGKIFWDINAVASYTYVRSEYKGITGDYAPSAWDSRNIFISTFSKKFGDKWNFGLKWRFSGGLPYTPFDLEKSSLRTAWDIQNQAYFNYDAVNSMRLGSFHQLDIRIDRYFYMKNSSLRLYLDIQNLYNFKSEEQDRYTNLDENGVPMIDPNNSSKYILRAIENNGSGTVLPTIGLILDF